MKNEEFRRLSEEEASKLGPEERMEYLRRLAAHLHEGMDETNRQINERGRNIAVHPRTDELTQCFCRNPDASWTCAKPCTFEGPGGRIQVTAGSTFYPGTTFMGFDLAAWLEEKIKAGAQPCPSYNYAESGERRRRERRKAV